MKIAWVLALAYTGPLCADTWSDAQTLFDQRYQNRQAIEDARVIYKRILNENPSPEEKIRAVSQLGRLTIYEGEMILPKSDTEGRRAIFQDCFCKKPEVVYTPLPTASCKEPGYIETISPKAIGLTHPAYTFFRAVCTAYWGEVAGTFEKLAYVPWLKESLTEGLKQDTRFEGGGIYRVASGVYVNPAAAPVQLYDPEQALKTAQSALEQGAYPGDVHSGSSYYENHVALVTALIRLDADRPQQGNREKALEKAIQFLKEMDERKELDDRTAGREAEFEYAYGRLLTHYKNLSGEDWQGKRP